MRVDQRFDVREGGRDWRYEYVGGLLFLTTPGVQELLARCSSLETARRLAGHDACRRAAGRAPSSEDEVLRG